MELADAVEEVISEPTTSKSVEAQRRTIDGSLNTDSLITDYSPRTLHSELASRPRLPPVEAAQLVLRLAGALAHLHAHGLVHRDIKPSNVIFVDGKPKLADIGLVTDVGSSHSFVGTEGFIPPEGPGTPQADLYGLGKLLYELATGRDRMDFPQLPPLAASGGEPRAARRGDGVTTELRSQRERSHHDEFEALLELNEVMTRACAPEPKQRYACATELQVELNLFLAGRSLRHARNIERTLARLKNFAAAACVFLLLAAGALWFVKNEERHANERARQATERARTEAGLRQRAQSAERETQQQLYTALLEQARATVLSGEMGQRVRALDAVRRAGAISNSVALRGAAVSALALPDLRFERELPIPSDLTLVQLDPAFDRIALGRGNGPVEIRSVSDQRLLATLPASANRAAYVALWSPDGRFLAVKRDDPASGGRRPDVEVWDVAAAQRLHLLTNVARSAFSFHPRLPRLIAGLPSATAVTWDLESGREVTRHALGGEPELIKFSPDGEQFAALHTSGKAWMLTIHRADDGMPRTSRLFTNNATAFDWHPTGRWIAVSDRSGTIHLMEAQTGETRALGQHKANAVVTVFSPDGGYLFTGGWERELICWDVKAMRRAFTIGLDSLHLQFRADGRRCVIPRWQEARVQLHAFERPALHREFVEDLGGRRNFGAFSPDGRWLAASGGERVVVWNLHSDGPGAVVPAEVETRVSFAANGELFLDRRGECSRWRLRPGTNVAAPPELERLGLARPAGFVSLCLVSNGVVFTGARGSKLAGYNQLTGDDIPWARTVDGLNGASADERWLGMFRAYSPHLYIHRLPDFERVAKLTNEARISRFVFSPLGDEVAVASRAGIEFWSTATWRRTRHLTNFTAILYSPDARTLWLSTRYLDGGLHDARTGEPLLPLLPNTHPLAVSPDGRHLAVSIDGQRLQVWDLAALREQFRALGLDWSEGQPAGTRSGISAEPR